jgi:hypothetical protein
VLNENPLPDEQISSQMHHRKKPTFTRGNGPGGI